MRIEDMMSNKVRKIVKQVSANQFKDLLFGYDGFGNRVKKDKKMYNVVTTAGGSGVSYKQSEVMVYGSSRLGVEYRDVEMIRNTGLVRDNVKY